MRSAACPSCTPTAAANVRRSASVKPWAVTVIRCAGFGCHVSCRRWPPASTTAAAARVDRGVVRRVVGRHHLHSEHGPAPAAEGGAVGREQVAEVGLRRGRRRRVVGRQHGHQRRGRLAEQPGSGLRGSVVRDGEGAPRRRCVPGAQQHHHRCDRDRSCHRQVRPRGRSSRWSRRVACTRARRSEDARLRVDHVDQLDHLEHLGRAGRLRAHAGQCPTFPRWVKWRAR